MNLINSTISDLRPNCVYFKEYPEIHKKMMGKEKNLHLEFKAAFFGEIEILEKAYRIGNKIFALWHSEWGAKYSEEFPCVLDGKIKVGEDVENTDLLEVVYFVLYNGSIQVTPVGRVRFIPDERYFYYEMFLEAHNQGLGVKISENQVDKEAKGCTII